MATVSKSFTAVGNGAFFLLRYGESCTYDVSGTFVGTVVLEKSKDGGQSFEVITSATAAASGTVVNEERDRSDTALRFRCSDFVSGTIVTAIADVAEAGPGQTFYDSNGVAVLQILDDGSAKFLGALDVDGALNADGAATLASTLAVTGAAAFSAAVNTAQGANIASASTINLDTATGNLVDVTGTTAITAITLAQGRWRIVRFTGALDLTHGASLVLPGAANITTAAGDMAIFAGYASGVVRLVAYMKLASIAATLAGTETLTNKTLTNPVINRTGQTRIIPAGALGKVGATAGWVAGAADNVNLATVPASQSGSTFVVPIPGLKVGDTITGFHLVGQIESAGGAVTLDAALRKQTAAAADVTDASIGAITQIAVTADTAVTSANSTKTLDTPEVVAADETFYVLLTATTAGSTDIALQGIAIIVTEA